MVFGAIECPREISSLAQYFVFSKGIPGKSLHVDDLNVKQGNPQGAS